MKPGPAGTPAPAPGPRPVDVCRALLDALDATEGRRRRRKRNTGADAIGIGMKRALLEAALRDDPDPAAFEGWLLEQCFERGRGEGAWRAMALEIFDEWRLARAAPDFRAWLRAGAPSEDKGGAAAPGLRDGRRALPILLVAAALGLAACGEEEPAARVPTIEVEEPSAEARQATLAAPEVLGPLLAGPGPDDTIYDPPVDLARPPGASRGEEEEP